jgi:hypothetical protein
MKERDVKNWIIVQCVETGDEAECESPESALMAALTLWDDAWRKRPLQGFDPKIRFVTNGVTVRICQRSALLASTGALRAS